MHTYKYTAREEQTHTHSYVECRTPPAVEGDHQRGKKGEQERKRKGDRVRDSRVKEEHRKLVHI